MVPIRVLVVDDQDMVRESLETFFEITDDMELVGSAQNREEAVRLCTELQPDIVLMDIMFEGEPVGIVTSREILETMPNTRIIALSSFVSPELVEEVFEAGVNSYLFKGISIDELASAICAVYQGKAIISPQIAQAISRRGE